MSSDTEVNAEAQPRRRVSAGRVDQLPVGQAVSIEIEGGAEIAIFNVNGEYFAIQNFCPHRGAGLSDGFLCDHVIECQLHGWQFDVRNGRCLTTDADIEAYEVEVSGGEINILV